jgi:putative zinc finger protein
MTDPTAGPPGTGHPLLTELAEWDEGLLDPAQTARLDAHVAGCPQCGEAVTDLREVTRRLAGVPAPPMPAAVAARLDSVLAGEVDRRQRRPTPPVADAGDEDVAGQVGWTRPTLGRFGEDLPRRTLGRRLLPALAAAVAAAVVGFGAYVVSASAGLNEPPVVAAVSSRSLGPQAGALERSTDLDPHRFSRAWQCARQATNGRIVALANSTVDGTPALLVYTRSGATTRVTVVTGCATGRPTPEQTAIVSRR